jgi:hypothetical protein
VALAAPPTSVDIPPIVYDDPFVCDGDPVIHVTYTTSFRLVTWTDRDGTLLRDAIFAPRTRVVLTDAATGKSLSGISPAVFRTSYNPDGSIVSLTVTGLNAAITLPGQGVILLDTGMIAWEGGFLGPTLAEGGPHAWMGSDDREAFCAYFRD